MAFGNNPTNDERWELKKVETWAWEQRIHLIGSRSVKVQYQSKRINEAEKYAKHKEVYDLFSNY